MKLRSVCLRRGFDDAMKVVAIASAMIGIVALAWILFEVVRRGAASFNIAFFTELPAPPGAASGGVASAIVGTTLITVIATIMGVPAGIMGGMYLAEYGRESNFGAAIRFTGNVMMGVPSIIVGIFLYVIVVVPSGRFSILAGAASLAVIMLPVVGRTTEEMLGLVPNTLRESALALGAPRWKVTISVVFRAARQGLITGTLLALARVSGETAPLLFTALNSPYWPMSIKGPTANLTVTIFNYAMSPYTDWQNIAWGASLLITIAVLAVSLTARLLLKEVRR